MTPAESDLRTKGHAVGPYGLARLEQHPDGYGWIAQVTLSDTSSTATITREREDAISWAVGLLEKGGKA